MTELFSVWPIAMILSGSYATAVLKRLTADAVRATSAVMA